MAETNRRPDAAPDAARPGDHPARKDVLAARAGCAGGTTVTSATTIRSFTTSSRSRSRTISTPAFKHGATYTQTFKHAGPVQLLCNIHASMYGYVFVVDRRITRRRTRRARSSAASRPATTSSGVARGGSHHHAPRQSWSAAAGSATWRLRRRRQAPAPSCPTSTGKTPGAARLLDRFQLEVSVLGGRLRTSPVRSAGEVGTGRCRERVRTLPRRAFGSSAPPTFGGSGAELDHLELKSV